MDVVGLLGVNGASIKMRRCRTAGEMRISGGVRVFGRVLMVGVRVSSGVVVRAVVVTGLGGDRDVGSWAGLSRVDTRRPRA